MKKMFMFAILFSLLFEISCSSYTSDVVEYNEQETAVTESKVIINKTVPPVEPSYIIMGNSKLCRIYIMTLTGCSSNKVFH